MKFKHETEKLTLNQLFKQTYSFHLDGMDLVKYNLISRYRKLLPYRFIKEYYRLREKGFKQGNAQLSAMVY